MTFEEFESLALNPPHREEETIFEVIEYDISPLPERIRCHYPRFDVFNIRIGFAHSLEKAEALMQNAIKRASEYENEIYCFHIKEYPFEENLHSIGVDLGISCRLYDGNGKLLDHTYCSDLDRDFHTKYGHFRGRPQEAIRFKAGEIVEVLCGDEVILAITSASSPTIEWCWDLRDRISQGRPWQRKDGKPLTDEEIEAIYFLDCSDDQITVLDGTDGSHEHVSPLYLMHPRYPVSKRLTAKLKSYSNTE